MKKLLKTTLVLVICATILFASAVGLIAAFSSTMSLDKSLLPVAIAEPVFFSASGNKMNYESNSALEPSEIPQNLKNAFVALEDKRFYSHHGYDIKRIGGAMLKNIKVGKSKEGASTITQQLIKNTHLTSEKTMQRKINELFLATKLEKEYSKDEILSMYLSVIYFGGGIYGARDAGNYYFGKELSKLSVAECATLAGIVKNPSAYSPKNNLKNSTERRNLVLRLMNEQGMIDNEIYSNALNEQTVVTTKEDVITGEKAYLKQCIREILDSLNITRNQLENSGFIVHTHYNETAQNLLVRELQNKGNYNEINLEGAGALLDNQSRGVIAYYSTIPYAFRRQAGSVIKPLVAYAPALDKGFITMASPICDEKTDFGGYSPANYNGIYYGWTTPRDAIKKSMNTVAVKSLSYVGSNVGIEYGRKFGLPLDDRDNTLALALGGLTNGVTVLEMAGAYATFANDGVYSAPTFIQYIEKSNNDILVTKNTEERQVLTKENSALLTNVLLDTAKDGTARSLSSLPFQVASKTGTVGSSLNENTATPNTDAWNLSFTTAHTLAIWHGGIPTSETGGGNPTLSARKIWSSLYSQNTQQSFNPLSYNQSIANLSTQYFAKPHPKSFGIFSIQSFANSQIFDKSAFGFNNSLSQSKNLGYTNIGVKSKYSYADSVNKFCYPANFELPKTVVSIEIVNYALANEHRVLLASENTPKKFRKSELFAIYNSPLEMSETFTKIEVENFNVELFEDTITNFKNVETEEENDFEYEYEDEFDNNESSEYDNEKNNDNTNNIDGPKNNHKGIDNSQYNDINSLENHKNSLNDNDNRKDSSENYFEDNDEPNNYLDFKQVKISFDAKDIFCYKIIREIDGSSVIIDEIKNHNGSVSILDTPIVFDDFVTYKVVPFLNLDVQTIEGIASTQTIWISNLW